MTSRRCIPKGFSPTDAPPQSGVYSDKNPMIPFFMECKGSPIGGQKTWPASLHSPPLTNMISTELLISLRITVVCTFVMSIITYVYWDEIRKFYRVNLTKLLVALVFCALLMQLRVDIWLPTSDILYRFMGCFTRSILVGAALIITSAARMMSIVMIFHIIIMISRFALYRPELLLFELVVYRSLRISEAALSWLLAEVDS